MRSELLDFLKGHSDTDIFLFQEVYKSRFEGDHIVVPGYDPDFSLADTLAKSLPSHQEHFCQVLKDVYGLAAYVACDKEIGEKGEMLVARRDWYDLSDPANREHNRKLQWFEIVADGKKVLIVNAHLTSRPAGKRDSEQRLRQSEMIVRLLSMFDGPKILAGDFNLMPDTESIRMIEAAGMRNLVKEYGVKSTRNEIYFKFRKNPLLFADYIFISPEIKVTDFKVLPDIVSDHLPLCLEFEIE
jgi:endonuclease/exonuclease/phosphatase family metal-dependent hydrolase